MIVCCGEALIDMIPAKCTDTLEDGFVPRAGGSVFNTALALGRLGSKTAFFSGLSTDMFGQKLMQTLGESNVNVDLCVRSSRPTTMAHVTLTDGNASYLFHDENSAGRMISESDLPEISADATALFFGGISLAVEPCADTYLALAERECANRVIMVDPNIRPAFIADEVRFRARLDRMLKIADVVKVSDEDLAWLVPGELSLRERAEALLDKGPAILLVTAGGEGVDAYVGDGRAIGHQITSRDVVDTVGAGDSFNAGFLHSLSVDDLLDKSKLLDLSEQQILNALELGATVAGIVVTRAGANPPWARELTNAH